MFGFLGTGNKDANDPLTSGRNTSVWLRQLPAQDVIGRQQHVMRAFDALRQSRRPFDLGRVQAIEYLDSALGADRRQLMKQYVENHDATGKLAERIWQAAYDLTQGFLHAYQTGLEEAVRQDGNTRWSAALPLLFARLLHYYGTDAKLRVFRFERWIPGKWMEVHRTYLRAAELGVDRAQAMLGSAGPNATPWTPEQEYLNALLIHQLNTGNLSPSQLDWAGSQLRAWSRKLVARRRAAFSRGLLRRSRRQGRSGAPHRHRRRIDAALPRHHAARRVARARGRTRCAAPSRPTSVRPHRSTSSASRSSRRCALPSRRTSTPSCARIRASPARSRRACASGSRASAASSR